MSHHLFHHRKQGELQIPGERWSVQSRGEAGPMVHEGEGVFDELWVDDWLHIEEMEDGYWWMRVGDAEIHVDVDLEGRVTVDVVRGSYGPIVGTTTNNEQVNGDGEPGEKA